MANVSLASVFLTCRDCCLRMVFGYQVFLFALADYPINSQMLTCYKRCSRRNDASARPLRGTNSKSNHQGGKVYGQLKAQQEASLQEINRKFLEEYQGDNENKCGSAAHLEELQKMFMEFDEDNSGDIDLMELKRMMEKFGQAKTHLELKKMIAEVDRENRGSISYNDFLHMMCGKKSSILKLILMFEQAMQGRSRPKGVTPKRDLSALP